MTNLHERVQVGRPPRVVGQIGILTGTVHEHHVGDNLTAPARRVKQRGSVAPVVVPTDTK